MRLVAFDLDDTLMWCGQDYIDAKEEFGAYIANQTTVSEETAIETVNRFDSENVDKFGLSMDRFPQSFVDAYDHLIDSPTDDGRQHVRELGYSVFKTADEYAERGFMDGAESMLTTLRNHGVDLHLITAGDERVQQPKIEGLGLESYFDDIHITGLNTKSDTLVELMDVHNYTPMETFLIGNSIESDIKAAVEAEANGVFIPTHQWRSIEDEDYYRQHEQVHIYPDLNALEEDSPHVFTNGASMQTS